MELGSRGYVTEDPSQAIWGMEFVPPLRLDYRIAYVDPDYRTTLVARERRDLLWIMARTPQVEDAELGLIARAEAMGYDPDAIFTALSAGLPEPAAAHAGAAAHAARRGPGV